ncbi:hypothetical protein ACFQ2B_00235 [Streptomyces stramineus]
MPAQHPWWSSTARVALRLPARRGQHLVAPSPSAAPADITREDGTRTLRLDETAVLTPWRGTGTARKVHDHLLAGWTGRATLMVNPLAGNGKVQAVYERWGYVPVGHAQPQDTAPVLTVMIRPGQLATWPPGSPADNRCTSRYRTRTQQGDGKRARHEALALLGPMGATA